MNTRLRRGNMIIEAAMWIPICTLLLVGMAQIGKITYTYCTLRKTVYSIAQYISSQQAANFCDSADTVIAAGISFGITGTTDNTGTPLITGLTADMIQVTPELFDVATQSLVSWDTTGCDTAAGGTTPQFIVVSIPNGYLIQPRIPLLPVLNPIPLKPVAKVPYGG